MAAKDKCNLVCCNTKPEALEKIRADISEWEPGKWAELVSRKAACHCGASRVPRGGDCHRHPTFGPTDGPFDVRTEIADPWVDGGHNPEP